MEKDTQFFSSQIYIGIFKGKIKYKYLDQKLSNSRVNLKVIKNANKNPTT